MFIMFSLCCFSFFFFKQKTAYEMRISDWSSDVCSSDLLNGIAGAEARGILERRGVSTAIAKTFGLGFAPDSRGKLKAALKDYGDPMLVEAGLLIGVEGKEPYDRFRGRLMIPIQIGRAHV